ncbi:MAG: bifunctional oligoribonuclease/PAP phosphatase NrnA [Vicinamibacterales bacterium]|nr:bifunctional oligoribonuclease/PAP phosphatase NrnA [Vicinamibacterales bacterium]
MSSPDPLAPIAARLHDGHRFIVSSHERPDGDAIGSGLAMVYALRALGKDAHMVMADLPAPYLQPFPGVDGIRIATAVDEAYDAAIVMECSTLARTGVAGLDRSPVVNIDHHPGNTAYGVENWIDESAAACGEQAFTLIERLGVPLSPEMATHIYLAILTDTGSFHFSHLTPRTYEIAGRAVAAGADPQWIARTHYDSGSLARVKLWGAVLAGMRLDASGRVAMLTITPAMAAEAGGTYDDTEGLINFPLTVKDIQAVLFLKEVAPGDYRISLRSKGATDIGAIAKAHGGGGHRNAAGCGASGDLATVQAAFLALAAEAVDRAAATA